MNIPQESLETALRNHGRATTVQRVISMKSESALPKGENYLSTIYRITLKVVLGNGRIATRSLILKVVPPGAANTEFVENLGVFKSETMMYTIVLREMEALMEEFNDTNDVLWCRLLHYEPYTSLLLEDLKASGFRMTRRQDCLDLEHSLLVLRSLGRFHAMAKILEQRGIIVRSDYKPYPLTKNKNLVKCFMYYGLQTLSKAMEESWGPEWYDVAQKLKIPCDVLMEKMAKLGEVDESRFNCLNHGDCWSNNMMFKYDWQNRPYTMRFIDLQICHYQSPVIDVIYFMNASVFPETRRQNKSLLLNSYLTSLNSTLDFLKYEGNRLTMEMLEEDLKRLRMMELFTVILPAAVTQSEGNNPFDMEIILQSEGTKGMDISVYGDIFKQRFGPDLKDLSKSL